VSDRLQAAVERRSRALTRIAFAVFLAVLLVLLCSSCASTLDWLAAPTAPSPAPGEGGGGDPGAEPAPGPEGPSNGEAIIGGIASFLLGVNPAAGMALGSFGRMGARSFAQRRRASQAAR